MPCVEMCVEMEECNGLLVDGIQGSESGEGDGVVSAEGDDLGMTGRGGGAGAQKGCGFS